MERETAMPSDTHPTDPPWLTVEAAARLLRAGELVGLPTETVYGLAADASNPMAVARVFAAKGRPSDHPLIVHVADLAAAQGYATPEALARPDVARLAAAFWPGPLTLVLPRGPLAHDAVTGGRDTIALRVPAHPVALAVLSAFGGGLAAPSANRYGRISPTTAAHVRDELGAAIAGVVDGGPCAVGIESTILDLSGPVPEILRQGGVSPAELAAVLGVWPAEHVGAVSDGPRAPGMVASHYAPRARLEVVAATALPGRARALAADGVRVATLTPEALGPDSEAWARNLYRLLREADATSPDVILAPPAPAGRLEAGVADRLTRASAARPG
jgi:L-threonylcarbamoyladenylate synthase